MTFSLEKVVPWGRSYSEYLRMFGLDSGIGGRSVIGCADGPASFNAEATVNRERVVSVDPLYRFSKSQIDSRIRTTFVEVMSQTEANQREFVWKEFASPEELGKARMSAMNLFLDDYDDGRKAGRYIDASLPELPISTGQFDLALCSHYLFLYSDHLDREFHIAAILEMLRVAREVRIFPLANLGGKLSIHLAPVRDHLRIAGYEAKLQKVPYEFVRESNQMLRITASGSVRE